MFIDIFLDVLSNVWPMLFIFSVIIISLRILYLIVNKKKFVFYKELLMFCFIIYILMLYYIVTFQDNNYGTNNFMPFKEIFRYDVTSRLFVRNVLGNVLLFVPFGLFTSYCIHNKNIWPSLFLTLLVSCSIEFAQSAIGRTADIDDIILNTIGGILGYLIYKIFNKVSNKLPSFMKSQIFMDVFAVIVIVIIILLFYKFGLGGLAL